MREALAVLGLLVTFLFLAFTVAMIAGFYEYSHGVRMFVLVGCAVSLTASIAWAGPILASPSSDAKIKSVQSTGGPLFACRTSGSVNGAGYGWPLLRVAVYQGGVVIENPFFHAWALLDVEIESIQTIDRWFNKSVNVHHTAPDIVSPIWLAPKEDLARQLNRFVLARVR